MAFLSCCTHTTTSILPTTSSPCSTSRVAPQLRLPKPRPRLLPRQQELRNRNYVRAFGNTRGRNSRVFLRTGEPGAHIRTICEQQRAAKMFTPSKFPTQCFITLLFAFCTSSLAANWQATVSKDPVGNFHDLRPVRASYRFGWSWLTAATGEIHFTKPSRDKFLSAESRSGAAFPRWRLRDGSHPVSTALEPSQWFGRFRRTETYLWTAL